MTSRPIIIVTGANGGVGFGICQRLLEQLSQKNCPDARAAWITEQPDADEPVCTGLTLIMACRSPQRAETAKQKLMDSFQRHVEWCKRSNGYDGHAELFAANLSVDTVHLDLAEIHSVFRFSEHVAERYPYVSHIICNAGVAGTIGIDWPLAIKQILTAPLAAVTAPSYNLQRSGVISTDGLGWVWQCNLFGHYVLFRRLEQMLDHAPRRLGGRVLWMSSGEASHRFYDPEDYQLMKTDHAYETSKFYINIISAHLDLRAVASSSESTVRHIVIDPGVASTSIAKEQIGTFLNCVKVLTFYLARLVGSRSHTITVTNAAVSATHLSLLSLDLLPSFPRPSSETAEDRASSRQGRNHLPLVKYMAQANVWGQPYVCKFEIREWSEFEDEGKGWLEQCDKLYDRFCQENTGLRPSTPISL